MNYSHRISVLIGWLNVMFSACALTPIALLLVALFVSHISGASQRNKNTKPNFVILFADDVSSDTCMVHVFSVAT